MKFRKRSHALFSAFLVFAIAGCASEKETHERLGGKPPSFEEIEQRGTDAVSTVQYSALVPFIVRFYVGAQGDKAKGDLKESDMFAVMLCRASQYRDENGFAAMVMYRPELRHRKQKGKPNLSLVSAQFYFQEAPVPEGLEPLTQDYCAAVPDDLMDRSLNIPRKALPLNRCKGHACLPQQVGGG